MKLVVSLVALAALAIAQDAAPVFEVASIKLGDPAETGTSFRLLPGGGLRVTGASLRALITYAYNIRNFQLSGGPGWVNTDRFDIMAKAERSGDETPVDLRKSTDAQRRATAELARRRTQALLGERFQLVLRRETKEMPIYALVTVKGGVKMAETKEADSFGTSMSTGNRNMTCRRCTTEQIAISLSGITGRPVRDETGLTAKYDFKMEWTPDARPTPDRPDALPAEVPAPEGPTLYTALQEILGLKLEGKKGPVEVYIIERAEKPSEN